MGYYTDLWKKQKQSGVYQTKDGGKVYKNEAARQADKAVQAAVQSAAQQQASGTYKTTSGGTVKSTAKPSTTYIPKSTGITVPNIIQQNFTPTPAPAKTRTNPKQIAAAVPNGAAIATSDRAKAVASQYYKYPQMFQGGKVQDMETTLSDEVTKPTGTIATASLGYAIQPKDNLYNRDTALWLLDKYGMTEADLGGVPLEALYTGNHQYTLPYLLKYPDNHIILSGGQQITIGELKRRLTNGMYVPNSGMTGTAQTTATPVETAAESYYDDGYYEDDGYSIPNYAQDIIDAQNAHYQALIQALQGQSGMLDQQYAGSARDLYANYVRQGLALPEQLAGTSTGTADSMLLQNDLNYQNNLYQNELARQAAQQDLQNQINQYGAEAALQSAQTAAEWAQLQWQQEQAEREAEREYQLNLAKLQQQKNSGDDGPSYSELSKMYADGAITLEQYQQMAGVSPSTVTTSPGTVMSESDAVKHISQTLSNYVTPENVAGVLNSLLNAGKITEATARKVANRYNLEMQ